MTLVVIQLRTHMRQSHDYESIRSLHKILLQARCLATTMYRDVQVSREGRKPGATDVQGCTSVARGQEARSDRYTGMYKWSFSHIPR